MADPLNILVIEDDPADFQLVDLHLQQKDVNARCTRVDSIETLERAIIGEKWDLILSDYSVPGLNFLDSFALIQSRVPDLPVIMVSGSVGEEKAVDLLKMGVWDIVLKDRLTRLVPAIERCLHDVAERRALKRAEEALAMSERLLREAQLVAHLGSYVYDFREDLWTGSPILYDVFGMGADYPRTLHGWSRIVHPAQREEMAAYLRDIVGRQLPFDKEYRIIRRNDGEERWVHGHGGIEYADDGTPLRMVGIVQDITSRRQAEETLRKLYAAVEQSPAVIVITDVQGRIEYANPRFAQLTGYGIEEVAGQNPRMLKGDTPAEVHRNLWATISGGRVWEGDFHNLKKDGTFYWEHAIIAPIRNETGGITHYLAIKEDITERRSLEEQLRQSQKMEAVGTLAGGIAHDFNNILTAIIGYSTLLQMEMEGNDKIQVYADNLLALSERAATLTRGLLTFSRKQVMSPKMADINDIVTTITRLIGRLIGEHITVETRLSPSPLTIMADGGQVEQVLMNLATNARDAMPGGGRLQIATDLVNLKPEDQLLADAGQPGPYALLSVSDTGSGMDEETRSRIFEPFFTTKETGKGTGLGLSIIYGIIRQHQGTISVSSRPGKGTTVNVYLPLVEPVDQAVGIEKLAPAPGGSETILIVEDDPASRKIINQVLQQFGYRVIEAADGEEAVTIFRESHRAIPLVILDTVMPQKNGKEAFDAIAKINPDVKALFISGYSADIIAQRGLLPEGVFFIQKPVSPMDLLKSIRQLLDGQVAADRGLDAGRGNHAGYVRGTTA